MLFITVAVLSFNLFGDGLRDALDPQAPGDKITGSNSIGGIT